MEKLNQLRDKEANSYDGEHFPFVYKQGFDHAIGLDLPVLFAEWSNDFARDNPSLNELSWNELYKYWINNVYQH